MPLAKSVVIALSLSLLLATGAFAHCDTLSGPVVTAARIALKNGEATPVLRWVQPQYEAEIRQALEKALAVRSQSADAGALADQWFFETVVRLHRLGEGEPFTGLRAEPAEPILAIADAALAQRSPARLQNALVAHVSSTLRQRFDAALEASGHAGESVESGRRYVAAYVELMHFIEAVHSGAGAEHVMHDH